MPDNLRAGIFNCKLSRKFRTELATYTMYDYLLAFNFALTSFLSVKIEIATPVAETRGPRFSLQTVDLLIFGPLYVTSYCNGFPRRTQIFCSGSLRSRAIRDYSSALQLWIRLLSQVI